MTNHDPKAKYLEQPWHTVDTLRELAREQDAQLVAMSAKLGAAASLDVIERTPGAWRIYGAIEHFITKGYDADHILAWLTAGEGHTAFGTHDTEQSALYVEMLDALRAAVEQRENWPSVVYRAIALAQGQA